MFYIQITINNFSSNITDLVLNKIYYNFKINDIINILLFAKLFIFAKNFDKLRLIKREKINNIIIFAFFIIKIKYNSKYFVFDFKKENEMHFRLYYNYSILNLFNKKLLQQKINSFKILIKIDYLIYRFQLFFVMRIYSIISVI